MRTNKEKIRRFLSPLSESHLPTLSESWLPGLLAGPAKVFLNNVLYDEAAAKRNRSTENAWTRQAVMLGSFCREVLRSFLHSPLPRHRPHHHEQYWSRGWQHIHNDSFRIALCIASIVWTESKDHCRYEYATSEAIDGRWMDGCGKITERSDQNYPKCCGATMGATDAAHAPPLLRSKCPVMTTSPSIAIFQLLIGTWSFSHCPTHLADRSSSEFGLALPVGSPPSFC
jgi:hypothetical protein